MSAGPMSSAYRRRCRARTRRGEPCRMAPVIGSDHCFTHAPEKARDLAEARKRGGQARQTPRLFELPATPVALRDVVSVQGLLERVVHETLAQSNGHDRSRALGSLLMIALRTLEAGDLEARIVALETRLAMSSPADRSLAISR